MAKTIASKRYLKKISQTASNNPLDGKSNQQAKAIINRKIIPHEQIKGFFSDRAWEGVNQIWKSFNLAGLNWQITKSEYFPAGEQPKGKKWNFEVNFTNNNGKPSILYGVVTASGAGSIQDPLDRYDITAYVG